MWRLAVVAFTMQLHTLQQLETRLVYEQVGHSGLAELDTPA